MSIKLRKIHRMISTLRMYLRIPQIKKPRNFYRLDFMPALKSGSDVTAVLLSDLPPFQVVDIGGEGLTKTGEWNVAGWWSCTTVLGATAAAGNLDGYTGLVAAMKRLAVSSLKPLVAIRRINPFDSLCRHDLC